MKNALHIVKVLVDLTHSTEEEIRDEMRVEMETDMDAGSQAHASAVSLSLSRYIYINIEIYIHTLYRTLLIFSVDGPFV